MIGIDTLHVLEYGPAAHVVGNVFYEVAATKRGSWEARTEQLWLEVQEMYGSLGTPLDVRLSQLKASWYMDPSAPLRTYPCTTTAIKARQAAYQKRVTL